MVGCGFKMWKKNKKIRRVDMNKDLQILRRRVSSLECSVEALWNQEERKKKS